MDQEVLQERLEKRVEEGGEAIGETLRTRGGGWGRVPRLLRGCQAQQLPGVQAVCGGQS